MRVILQVVSGPETGRKFLLGAGQMLQVGRTEWADVAFAHDGQMSSVHFLLETDGAACYLKDLGSSNGTFVNGQRLVQRVTLHDGDTVLAGQTQFTVSVEGLTVNYASLPVVEPNPILPAGLPPATLPRSSDQRSVSYSVETCDSGLTLCRGDVGELAPADLAFLLGQLCPVYLVVDFRNLGAPPPSELTSPQYLFDWLGPAAAASSPVIIAQDDLLSWPTLIEQGWGNDAVIGLFSREDKPSVLEHLRRCCLAKARADDHGNGIIGYCWPSVLAPLLTYSTIGFLRQLLAGIEAVLVELPDLPDTWQLYGNAQIVQTLDQLGFQQQQPRTSAAPGRP